MSAITVRISDSLQDNLNAVAKYQDKPKSRIIKRALENYLLDIMEDMEDIKAADEAIEQIEAGGKTIPWEQVKRECGLLLED